MKITPLKKTDKDIEAQQKKLEVITYRIALLVSAVSVYYFFIKILFL
ncbi:hypothetical protein IWX76_000665 [Pedobacter sp. CAN_A7]